MRTVLAALAVLAPQAAGLTCPGNLDMTSYGRVALTNAGSNVPGQAAGQVELPGTGALVAHMDARVYFADMCSEGVYSNTNYMALKLLGSTMRYTIDVSGAGCGCNAAFYLVSMRQNAQVSSCGDFYCDANKVCGVPCAEVDIQEASKRSWHSTLHSGSDSSGLAAGYGGGGSWNGPRDFTSQQYGPGAMCIDTSQPFDVAVSFPTDAQGGLAAMEVTLSQRGKNCPLKMRLSGYDQMGEISAALAAGMTPVLSYWKSSDMLWMDGKGADQQGPCASDAQRCSETVSFSNFSIEGPAARSQTPPPSQASPSGGYTSTAQPGQALPSQIALQPGQASPSQASPGQALPGQALPGQALPGQVGQPGQPGQLGQSTPAPWQPWQPAQPTQPALPVQPAQPGQTAQPGYPGQALPSSTAAASAAASVSSAPLGTVPTASPGHDLLMVPQPAAPPTTTAGAPSTTTAPPTTTAVPTTTTAAPTTTTPAAQVATTTTVAPTTTTVAASTTTVWDVPTQPPWLPVTAAATTTMAATAAPTTTGYHTTAATTTLPLEQCTNQGGDCRRTHCCKRAGFQCYEKNEWWASCNRTCKPGVDMSDSPQNRQPWSCKEYGLRTPERRTTTTTTAQPPRATTTTPGQTQPDSVEVVLRVPSSEELGSGTRVVLMAGGKRMSAEVVGTGKHAPPRKPPTSLRAHSTTTNPGPIVAVVILVLIVLAAGAALGCYYVWARGSPPASIRDLCCQIPRTASMGGIENVPHLSRPSRSSEPMAGARRSPRSEPTAQLLR